MYSAFEDLNEAYNALINEKSIEGVMEEVFTATEYIKKKNNPLFSVVHFFEEKHGYGVAFKNNPFGGNIILDNCIRDVVQFVVNDDKYAVITKFVGNIEVWFLVQSFQLYDTKPSTGGIQLIKPIKIFYSKLILRIHQPKCIVD